MAPGRALGRGALAAAYLMGVAGTAAAGDHRVTQFDKRFTPGTLTIRGGDTITFVNDDLTIHNVTSETPGHEFEIKRQNPRQSHTVSFTKPGTFEVFCRYHGSMKLTVTVAP